MILAHADDTLAAVIDLEVGIAEGPFRRDRLWQAGAQRRDLLSINAPIAEIREYQHAVLHPEVAAAILVNAGTGVEVVRCQVLHLSIGRASDDNTASTLCWPCFAPINVLIIECHTLQDDPGLGQLVGTER